MSEMILRVAKAIALDIETLLPPRVKLSWDDLTHEAKLTMMARARVAIAAMRDLPPEMRWEGYVSGAFAPECHVSSIQFDPKPVWEALIDKALT